MMWKNASPPEDLFPERWRTSWLEPLWELTFWTDPMISAYSREVGGLFRDVLDRFDGIRRADAFRYLILKRMGGLYVDLDFLNLRPLSWLESHEGFTCGEHVPGTLCNAWMWAPRPGDPFFADIEEALAQSARERDPVLSTGPRFLTRYAGAGRRIDILPSRLLYPIAWDDTENVQRARRLSNADLEREFSDSAAIHLWSASWIFHEPTKPDHPASIPVG